MKWFFCIAAVLFIATGCATAPPAGVVDGYPAWYLDPGLAYPEDRYLAAVGSGSTRRDAEQQAMAGLAQIFEANIQVDVRAQERYREIVSSQGTFTDQEMELAQTTSIQSVQRLLNVQFSEAAVDNRGMVHTIAYLERVPTGMMYMDMIQRNSSQVQSFLREASASSDPLRRYAYISAAAAIAAGNQSLVDQLRIISPNMSRTVSLGYDYNNLMQQRSEEAENMRVSVSVSGDHQDRIQNVVSQALSAEGYSISQESPVMNITGTFSMIPVELNPQFKSVRWILGLKASRPDGSIIVTFDEQGRASGVTEDAAATFAYQDVRGIVENSFMGAVRAYMDQMVLGK